LSYETFISISLTAVTVVLAVLALLIGILALWGYRAIKDEARVIAEKASKDKIAELLDGESIRDKLKEEVSARLTVESAQLFDDLRISLAFPIQDPDLPGASHDGEKISEQYPGPNPNDNKPQ
jgi:hypothetical protein